MLATGLVIAVLAALLGYAVAALVRRNAARLGLVQSPNARSSHLRPTPTGGGLGIAAGGTLAGLPLCLADPWLTTPVLMAGLLMAAMGYFDDRRSLPVGWRLGTQLVLVGAVISLLPLDLLGPALGLQLPDALLFAGLALCGTLWINLYNFMDGIDGLAGAEAVFVLLGAVLLAALGQPDLLAQPLVWWMAGLAAACLGFLALNWAPARLFMGDAGSTYLGLMIGFFALATILAGWLGVWQWAILVALFITDALVTLLRRLSRRERIWEAHRRHAYQRLQRRLNSHGRATLAYLAIDLVVLLPLAGLAGVLPQWSAAIALATYALLVVLALIAGAGAPLEPQADKEGAGAHDRQ